MTKGCTESIHRPGTPRSAESRDGVRAERVLAYGRTASGKIQKYKLKEKGVELLKERGVQAL